MTGNVKRFLNKVGLPHFNIDDTLEVNEPYIIVTNTIGFGDAPKEVIDFIEHHLDFLVGVAASGNTNWRNNYAHAADVISEKYNVPIIYKFELGGSSQDTENFRRAVKVIGEKLH
jgi:protein involved in ribonucleotide reduction